jgi:hypothetical protein
VTAEGVGVAKVGFEFAADGGDPDEVQAGGDQGEVPERGIIEGEAEVGIDILSFFYDRLAVISNREQPKYRTKIGRFVRTALMWFPNSARYDECDPTHSETYSPVCDHDF